MPEEDDGTPAHLRQLDAVVVDLILANLRTIDLGYGTKLEIDAFAQTRTIHDGRRVLYLLRFDAAKATFPEYAEMIAAAIDELETILPTGD